MYKITLITIKRDDFKFLGTLKQILNVLIDFALLGTLTAL